MRYKHWWDQHLFTGSSRLTLIVNCKSSKKQRQFALVGRENKDYHPPYLGYMGFEHKLNYEGKCNHGKSRGQMNN